MSSESGHDNHPSVPACRNPEIFRGQVNTTLKDFPQITREAIASTVLAASARFANDLALKIPLNLLIRDSVTSAVDYMELQKEYPGASTCAAFIPHFDSQGKMFLGTVEFDYYQLVKTAMSITKKNNRSPPSVPWSLVGDLAHEFFHAHQHKKYHQAMARDHQQLIDGKIKWFHSRPEYAASLYEYQAVRNYPVSSFVDRVDKWFYLRELKTKLQHMRKSREAV